MKRRFTVVLLLWLVVFSAAVHDHTDAHPDGRAVRTAGNQAEEFDLLMPCTIRVAVRLVPEGALEPPAEGVYEIREVELSEYVVRVLAHEFGDFTDDDGTVHSYTAEPLKAGAVAALMYAWSHTIHPSTLDYDLDNSKRFQVYIPDKPYEPKHVDAVRAIWSTAGTDWMNQRGALYLADTRGYTWGQILRYYYRNIEFHQHTPPCAGPQ